MLGAIAASVWIGYWLDGKTQTSIPWFSITLPVITVIGLLVRIMNDTRPKKK
jgi:F0F1-type ATP synthase assembly protein I